MRCFRVLNAVTLLWLFCTTVGSAQQAVPKLVRFSGSFRAANGLPAQSVESVTLAVYRDQTGGDALWHEIQNVVVDADGSYSVLMGSARSEGMPIDLFASGEPCWLGVLFNRPGEAEHPRVLLVSVPYALKAADAETLGGKPASAYLLAAPTAGTDNSRESTKTAPGTKPKATPANSGQPNYIGKFANTADLINSSMYESNGNVGIFTAQPLISLDVRTGALPQMGIAGTTDYLTFFASDQYGPAIYWDPARDMRFGKGGTGLYNAFGFVEQMRIKASNGNVGIGTQAPVSKLDVVGDINLNGSVLFQGTAILRLPGGTGQTNTATGLSTMPVNTSGSSNTATGFAVMLNNTTGNNNTATGFDALSVNSHGNDNTATGFRAMENTTGSDNTAIGSGALHGNFSGSGNIAVGQGALRSNTSGSDNIAIGNDAAVDVAGGDNSNIHIGSPGVHNDSATIRIGGIHQGRFFVAGVRGITASNDDAIAVLIDSNGQLGTKSSSRRFKEDIEDMGVASRDLMRLRPVTFRYKEPFYDGSKPIQYGLIAEEVAEVYPELVAHSADGQIETVKYQVLDSMLLNEVQRQKAEFDAQVRRLEQQNQSLQERLAKLEAALASMPVVKASNVR